MIRILTALVLTTTLALPAAAQLDTRPTTSAISLDVTRSFLGGDDFGAMHSTGRLSARVPLGRWTAVAELPVAVGDFDRHFAYANGVGIGNPYVGVARRFGSGLEAEVGARLPLASNATERAGTSLEPLRVETYSARSGALAAALHGRVPITPTTTLHLLASPTLSVSTAEWEPSPYFPGTHEPSRLGLTFAGSAIAEGRFQAFAAGGGFASRADGNQNEFFAGQASDALVVGHAVLLGAAFRPGVQAYVPLGDLSLDRIVVGLSLDVPLR